MLLAFLLVAGSGDLVLYAQVDSTAQEMEFDTLIQEQLSISDTGVQAKGGFWSHDPHSPGKAALYSAILPGLGQAYNEKYWKIPIVYAGIGTSAYFIYYWDSFYKDLKTAYLARTDEDPLTVDTQYDYITSDATLLQYVYQTKKYSDLMVVVTSFVYLLNIVDAIVDAHLYGFDVSDDLSMYVRPDLSAHWNGVQSTSFSPGINITLRLK
ncbi:MAG: DUF5683 domain-containing protein [Chitinophagales bacterium]